MSSIEDARRWFAEDLRVAAAVESRAVIDAFAKVQRERFIGPPPWRIGARLMKFGANPLQYQTFDENDPRLLYHDLVVALDADKEINNGQPSLWASILDAVAPRCAERVVHIGCGTGYYSAILAEMVSQEGSVFAVDVNPALVERARVALSPWHNVTAVHGDGAKLDAKFYDVIVVSAGLTHPLDAWLDSLTPEGRLVFPLTAGDRSKRSGGGAMLLVSRVGAGSFAARFLGPVAFIHFEGGRDEAANESLMQALRTRQQTSNDVRSLRRDVHIAGESCWLHGDGYCLSYEQPYLRP